MGEPVSPTVRSTLVRVFLALALPFLVNPASTVAVLGFWWESSTYGHGIVLPFLAAYLVWAKRSMLEGRVPRPSPIGLPVLFVMAVALAAAHFMSVLSAEATVLVAMVPVLVWTLVGTGVLRATLFPSLLLSTAAPVWDVLGGPLQDMTAWAAYGILRLLGMPILLDEYNILIPSGHFVIETACGGLHFFLAALVVGSVYAYLNFEDLRKRLLFVTGMLVLSVVMNWLRVCLIIVIGYLTEMQSPIVDDHYTFGWILFSIGMTIYLVVVSRYADGTGPRVSGRSSPVDPASDGHATGWGIVLVAVFVLAVPPVLSYLAERSRPSGPPAETWSLPDLRAEGIQWRAMRGAWHTDFEGARRELKTGFAMDGLEGALYLAYYVEQAQGAELVNSENALFDDIRWTKLGERIRRIERASGLEIGELELEGSFGARRRLVTYWYRVAGHETASPIWAKLLSLQGLVTGKRRSAIVAIAVDCPAALGCDDARPRLDRFIAAVHGPLGRMLDAGG